MKGIKRDPSQWGDAPPRGRFRAIKMSALPKAIYKLDVIAVKISKGLLIEWDKLIFKLIWKGGKTQS